MIGILYTVTIIGLALFARPQTRVRWWTREEDK